MTTRKASVEAGDEAVPNADDLVPADAPDPETGYRYEGPGQRVYPQLRDPKTGFTLVANWGDVFDFAPESPPADGFWYDTTSGLPYTGVVQESPASTEAGQEEEK